MREPQRIPGAKWWLARCEFIERGAQPVEVRPLVDRPTGTAGLLWRQIRQCSEDFGGVSDLWPDLGSRGRQSEID